MNIIKRNTFMPSFDDFFTRDLFDWNGWTTETGSLPRVNIRETDEDFLVEMAAPGMKKDDFIVELDNDILTITSETKNEISDKEGDNFTRKEFSYASFKRSFNLPNTIEADKIKAKYVDGILSLQIPKKEEAKKKPIKTISIS